MYRKTMRRGIYCILNLFSNENSPTPTENLNKIFVNQKVNQRDSKTPTKTNPEGNVIRSNRKKGLNTIQEMPIIMETINQNINTQNSEEKRQQEFIIIGDKGFKFEKSTKPK